MFPKRELYTKKGLIDITRSVAPCRTFLVCQICNKEFGQIPVSHLKTHGLTEDTYFSQFPDALTVTKETRNKISEAHKTLWEDPAYSERVMATILRGNRVSPNLVESTLLIHLSYNFPSTFKFTGDGKKALIEGCSRVPDYMRVGNTKQVIELFGGHWHPPEEEQERIEEYRLIGWSCLVVWEGEVWNFRRSGLLGKLKNFVGGN